MDDNSPFCPACEAAQVRTTPKADLRPAIVVAAGGTPSFSSSVPLAKNPENMDARTELRSAFYAAIIGALLNAVLTLIQPRAGFVLALPLSGFLSVLLFRRLSRGSETSAPKGFRIGAFTGLFVFGLSMIVIAISTLAVHGESDTHAQVMQIVQQAQARNPDPQARQAFEYFMTPQGMAVMMIIGFIFMAVLFIVLSGLGGAISASLLLRRKDPPRQ